MNLTLKNPKAKPYRHIALKLDHAFYDRLEAIATAMDRPVAWVARTALHELAAREEALEKGAPLKAKRSPTHTRATATKKVRGP